MFNSINRMYYDNKYPNGYKECRFDGNKHVTERIHLLPFHGIFVSGKITGKNSFSKKL